MISPRGGSANRSASSSSDPRTTSSKRFVSSRHTAAGRSGSSVGQHARAMPEAAGATRTRRPPRATSEARRERPQLARAPREVADELVAIGTPARSRRARSRRRTPREEPSTSDPSATAAAIETRSRIVDSGQARVGDERHALAGSQAIEDLRRSRGLVVTVVARRAARRSRAARGARACAACPRRGRRRPHGARSRTRSVTSSRFPIGVAQIASGIRDRRRFEPRGGRDGR